MRLGTAAQAVCLRWLWGSLGSWPFQQQELVQRNVTLSKPIVFNLDGFIVISCLTFLDVP